MCSTNPCNKALDMKLKVKLQNNTNKNMKKKLNWTVKMVGNSLIISSLLVSCGRAEPWNLENNARINEIENIDSRILIGCVPCTLIPVYTLPAVRKRLMETTFEIGLRAGRRPLPPPPPLNLQQKINQCVWSWISFKLQSVGWVRHS